LFRVLLVLFSRAGVVGLAGQQNCDFSRLDFGNCNVPVAQAHAESFVGVSVFGCPASFW
jgi:hypothetical protein